MRHALLTLMLATALWPRPTRAYVLSEDALTERSIELGLQLRAFSFLFTGHILRSPYLPYADPLGMGLFDARASFVFKSPHVKLVVHNQTTTRVLSYGGFSLSLGRGVPPPRWLPLQFNIAEKDQLLVRNTLDWVYAAFTMGPVTLTLGRQPITFGRGKFWKPTDLLSTFTLTEVDLEYKPGTDAFRVDVAVGQRGSLTLVAALGELEDDHDADVSLRGSSFFARYKHGFGRAELGVSGGFVRGDGVAGVDAYYDFRRFEVYAEVTLTMPTSRSLTPYHLRASDALLPPPLTDRVVPRAVVGATFKPTTKLTVSPELYYNGFGSFYKENYVLIAASERFAIGELFNVGRIYAALLVDWQATALFGLTLAGIANPRDPSGLLSITARYNVASNVDALGGVYIPISRLPNLRETPAVPRGEFGLYPYFFYAAIKMSI